MIDFLSIWGAYVYFPFAVLSVWGFYKGSALRRIFLCLLLVGPTLLAYGRFIEPHRLVVKSHKIDLTEQGTTRSTPNLRIALFSDTHFGIFPNAPPMQKIVNRINALENIDAVLIAGDLTYYPTDDQIAQQISELSNLERPVFAVLGNHDVGLPGPDLGTPVIRALDRAGVTLVENRAFPLEGKKNVFMAGTSDLWQRRQNFNFSNNLPDDATTILLTHNPDTALTVPDEFNYDLMLAGHTHGGQIRLPIIYKQMIPTEWPFDIGLHSYPSEAGEKAVFVTPGTGMVGLPFRFMMPPRIDVLSIYIE